MNAKTKIGLVALSLGMTMTPAAYAATEQEALTACMQVMKSDLEQRAGNEIAARLDMDGTKAQKLNRTLTVFHLDATNPKSGDVVARVDCTVNADAAVVDLQTLPLYAKSAELRSQRLSMY